MNSSPNSTNFSFEYIISIIIILVVCNLLTKNSPQMNSAIVILVGVVVGYLSLFLMNTLFPQINQFGSNLYQYYYFQYMNNFTNMGYMRVWPPVMAVLIIFVVLLYNKQLG